MLKNHELKNFQINFDRYDCLQNLKEEYRPMLDVILTNEL